MNDMLIPVIAIIALVGLMVALIINSSRRSAREHKVNFAVNNSIADLIEDGAITKKKGLNKGTAITKGAGSPRNAYAKLVYDIGFGTKTSVSAKKFHENLYVNRDTLRDSMGIVPANVLDVDTTPKARTESNASLAGLLPLLILGDEDGASGKAANDSYSGDVGYVGAHSYSSDCDSSGGGDSGGGDGGGGGGGGD